LGFDDDPESFEPKHDIVREMHRRMPGVRQGRTHAVVEALVASIIEQKVQGMDAWKSYARLVRTLGDPAPGPVRLMLPPSPERLAGTPYWRYHRFGLERRRADTIRRVCARAGRLEECAVLPMPEAYRRLTSFVGVGAWTAAEVARVALGDPDAVSVGDYHLPHLVAWVLAGERRADDARMLELLEPYAGRRARAVRLIEASGLGPPRRAPRMALRRIEAI
jgi:3-methyladenine DNA glycosylase/8-oxoguanine DNA glycosylase